MISANEMLSGTSVVAGKCEHVCVHKVFDSLLRFQSERGKGSFSSGFSALDMGEDIAFSPLLLALLFLLPGKNRFYPRRNSPGFIATMQF